MKPPSARALVLVLVALLIALLVVTNTVSTIIAANNSQAIRETQRTNTGTLNATEQTLDIIQSCTTPGRKCYDDGQEQTGKAVSSINKVAVAAAYCADKPNPQSAEQIERCVRKRLAPDLPAPR